MTSRLKRLSTRDLQLLVDQLVDDLLARRGLVGGQLSELGALLDVERRDRVAVDDDDDLLGVRAVADAASAISVALPASAGGLGPG